MVNLTILIIFGCFFLLDFPWANGDKHADTGPVNSFISCFTCNSLNWTDPSCHDPVDGQHHVDTTRLVYRNRCRVPKENHRGVFPAHFCVKMIGRRLATGEDLIVRACSLQSIGNQCGKFRFEGEMYKGCLLSCTNDACNWAHAQLKGPSLLSLLSVILLFRMLW